ncbi:hypothetical protein EJ06DRAFT_73153 [Trichodelitschia bisporula]|uniref:Uncharacterized protein n=1 Tax=Trichodelitschia bisporula TaxID=703511 RepID=A0A6G1HTF2_9PEZI|nr:hypothetical protein EJ06DRAFT_73153 [Trichodelitschia bisporula]
MDRGTLPIPRIRGLRSISSAAQLGNGGLSGLASSASFFQKRSPSSSSASASPTCTHTDDSNTCQKPTDTTGVLPIVLAVVLPVTAAVIVIIFLHRKYKKRLRKEDIADEEKYRSMDFGMDLSFGRQGKKGGTEMKETGPTRKHMRGLSIENNSPYLFPGVNDSRESFNSLARSALDADHRYRPTGFTKGDDMSIHGSIRSPSPATGRPRRDTESTAAGSTFDTTPNANLLHNAQANPKSLPPRGASLDSPPVKEPMRKPAPANTTSSSLAPAPTEVGRESFIDNAAFRKSNAYLAKFIHSRDTSVDDKGTPKPEPQHSEGLGLDASQFSFETTNSAPPIQSTALDIGIATTTPAAEPASDTRTAKFQSMQASIHGANTNSFVSTSSYGEAFKITPPSPTRDSTSTYATIPNRGQSLAMPGGMPGIREHPAGDDERNTGDRASRLGNNMDSSQQRLSIVVRPLPPDDPTENPEERANRIRSFYKEYFDDSGKHTSMAPAGMAQGPPQNFNAGDYYEDYGQEYMNSNATVYDHEARGFVVAARPFAQPITRRAMTPPPRAPPRFRGGSTASAGPRFHGQMTPRGQSVMSFRGPGSPAPSSGSGYERGRQPKKNLPPPAPLISLKSPHLMKDDSALFAAFDLAPPATYRDRQNGRRPDSPLGVERPYSPVVKAHVPLAGSFDDLAMIPSPHSLRRSGTFTALDFAPQHRFRNADPGSDAASIRSGHSGMSNQQVYALRAGAYRVSRVPKELAGTKDDIVAELTKPSWKLGY